MNRSKQSLRSASPYLGEGGSLGEMVRLSFRHPYEFVIRRWNWKAALTSSLVRGGIFFFANLSVGAEAAWAAFITEFAFRACTAGFYGAITQNLSRVRPAWQGTLGAFVLLPFINHSAEYLVHWLKGTPNLEASIFASVCFTVLSSAFHLSVMRRGLLVVGDGSRSLWSDLRQMPAAVAWFIADPFVRIYRALSSEKDSSKSARVSES